MLFQQYAGATKLTLDISQSDEYILESVKGDVSSGTAVSTRTLSYRYQVFDKDATESDRYNVTLYADVNGDGTYAEEEAIAMNPDVILTNVDYIEDAVNVIKGGAGWENVNAIKNDEVYYIDATSSNQPNNHVVDAMIEMGKKVYPDQFADFQ